MSSKAQRREKKRRTREMLQLRRVLLRLSGKVWRLPSIKIRWSDFRFVGDEITEPLEYRERP